MNRSMQIACAAVAVLFTANAFAQTNTWSGGSASWSNSANWTNGALVGSSTTSLFFGDIGGTTWSCSDDIAGGFQLNNLTFDNSGPCAILPTSPANYLTFVPNGSTAPIPTIAMDGAGSMTIASSMSINGTSGGTLDVNFAPGAGNLTLTGNLGGGSSSTLIINGGGMLTLAGSNSYGSTVINGGTLNFAAASNLGTKTDTITLEGGGTLLYSGTGSLSATSGDDVLNIVDYGTIDVSSSTGYINYYPNFSGTGTLTKTGPGMMWCHGSGNLQAGPFIVAQGTFLTTSRRTANTTVMTVQSGAQYELLNNTTSPQTADYSLASGAILYLNGFGPSNGFSGTSGTTTGAFFDAGYSSLTYASFTNNIQLQSDSSIVVGNTTAGTNKLFLYGNISGSGSLIKDYTQGEVNNNKGLDGTATFLNSKGLLALFGTNTYPGSTQINSGTILLQSNYALPNTPLELNSSYDGSSTLDLGGFSATVPSISTSGTGSAVISSTGSTGVLTVNYQGSTPMVYNGSLGTSPTSGNNFAFATTSGTVVLTGNNYYTQGTTIGPGATLQLNSSNTYQAG